MWIIEQVKCDDVIKYLWVDVCQNGMTYHLLNLLKRSFVHSEDVKRVDVGTLLKKFREIKWLAYFV